ncbi:MAG: hypothetical protein EPO25_10225 [Gammaproteobacteria bacterium]|nr:MAG: hypothetical protein EPO25_10225 [Gammaproteobacteria bacterium]
MPHTHEYSRRPGRALYRSTLISPSVALLPLAAIAALSLAGLEYMWTVWQGSPEFSHGPLIPQVALVGELDSVFTLGQIGALLAFWG